MTQSSSNDSPIEKSGGSLTDNPNDGRRIELFGSDNQETPTPSPQYGHIRDTRVTDEHVFFWNGPLSNWNVGQPFGGGRAVDLLIDRLDDTETSHPSRTALSTVMMCRHDFVCGEQFMMACKGWLFETTTIKGADLDTSKLGGDEVERICKTLLQDGDCCGTGKRGRGQRQRHQPAGRERVQQPKRDRRNLSNTTTTAAAAATNNKNSETKKSLSKKGREDTGLDVDVDVEIESESKGETEIDYDGMARGTLVACLLTPDPRLQKALGRRTRGFDEKIWKKASKAVAVAGNIARAEADEELRQVYMGVAGKNRNFVEGSPMDKVWGIGLRWDDPWADDETHWRGENRLGKCHDEAAEWIRHQHYNKEN